jgi:acyl-CoA synthetase (AMP-forming)/AMP-acid ligase II
MPQFHVHGLIRSLLAPLSAGGTAICAPGFQALHFLDWLEQCQPTWYTAVPTIHQAIINQARQRGFAVIQSTLRLIRSGSAPLRDDLREALEQTFRVPVIQGYGMTEAASQVASNPLPPHVRKSGSIGLPAGPEMAIIDEHGRTLGPDQPGEIVVRGPNVMTGYEGNQQATDAAFLNDWFRTGDLGYRDSDGYYFLTGRLRDLINRGGQKITPQEVDDVLLSHPSVAEAATFPVPDARLGEAVAAAVVLRPNTILTERQLAEFAACQLAFFKIPERIFFLQELPKGPTGKVKRSLLAGALGLSGGLRRAHAEEPHTDDAASEPVQFVLAQVMRTAAEVLDVKDVDSHRSFLESGGDSVRAMLFVARLSEAFRVELTFLDVFYAPSFVSVARTITARVLDQVESCQIEDDNELR